MHQPKNQEMNILMNCFLWWSYLVNLHRPSSKISVTSSRVHRYMFIVYDYNTNTILLETIKNIIGPEIVKLYEKSHKHIVDREVHTTIHWLDSESSRVLKEFKKTERVEYQLVPPHIYRKNAVEQEIIIWKDQFIVLLFITDDNLPLHLWYWLV